METILDTLIENRPLLISCRDDILLSYKILEECYSKGGKLLICGNGGSSSDADHIVGELMKSFELPRPVDKTLAENLHKVSPEKGGYIAGKLQSGLPAISLNAHTALFTAISNDIDPDLVFAQQIAGFGNAGDVLMAISTSGNAKNVVNAAITAKAKGLKVIGMSGMTGGALKKYCDAVVCIPSILTAEIQEYQLPVYHTLCRMLEVKFFT
jgi:D-sedoheptulose 7-phosphate isomerase